MNMSPVLPRRFPLLLLLLAFLICTTVAHPVPRPLEEDVQLENKEEEGKSSKRQCQLLDRYDMVCTDGLGCDEFTVVPSNSTTHQHTSASGAREEETDEDEDKEVEGSLGKRQMSPPVSFAVGDNDMFQYEVQCQTPPATDVMNEFCKNFIASLQVSGQYYTRILSLERPIRIKASLVSFCNPDSASQKAFPTLNCQNLLGSGKPSAFWTINGTVYSSMSTIYPQALAKQMTAQGGYEDKDLLPYDIELNFNSDAGSRFYFPDEVTKLARTTTYPPIDLNQYDFLYLVVHEFMHGLGMVSFYNNYYGQLPSQVQQSRPPQPQDVDSSQLLTPPINYDNQGNVVFMDPVGIYDTLLTTFVSSPTTQVRTPWSSTLGLIDGWLVENENPVRGTTQARALYASATRERSVIAAMNPFATDSDFFFVETPPAFARGTSLVHFSQNVYANTENFLMCPTAPAGVSMAYLSESIGGSMAPFGRSQVKMLAAFGYRLTESAQQDISQAMLMSAPTE